MPLNRRKSERFRVVLFFFLEENRDSEQRGEREGELTTRKEEEKDPVKLKDA